MAYLKDDPKKDQQDEVQANVLGDDGAQAASSGGSIQSSGQSQSSGGTSVTSAGQTAPQGAIRAGTGGRSGQFTDVKQYVDKNRPQGARIAEAAGKGVTSQAADIGKQITARKSALQDVLDQNAAQVQRDSAFATQQIQQAAATPAPVVMGPSDDQVQAETAATQAAADQQRFSDIMGQGTQLQATPELNLASQEIAARRLGQQEFNTQNLLQDAFAKPGRQYTAGQQRLDELLLGGTGFGSQLQQTARDASKTALGDIASLRRQAIADTAQQGIDQGQLSTDVMAQLNAARSGIVDPIQADIDAQKEGRSSLVDNLLGVQSDRDAELNKVQDFYKRLASMSNDNSMVGGYRSSALVNALQNSLRSGYKYSDTGDALRSGLSAAGFGEYSSGSGLNSIRDLFGQQKLQDLGLEGAADRGAYGRIKDAKTDISQDISDLGIDTAMLRSGDDLTLANLASNEQIARYNALQGLAGDEQIIAPETKGSYASNEQLQELINKYQRSLIL